ncbi:MAG: helix-turn-helix domain-containing protein [Pseudonocardiales bacterium]|nr:helix-turn-helix domain-containing protein [Pseudonocardiales bacterium]
MDADDDARTIGRRLRRIRKGRRKSLIVVAGLAGMSKSKLDRIERGEVALDSLSDIVALANALQIAPSELIRLPFPAPANGPAALGLATWGGLHVMFAAGEFNLAQAELDLVTAPATSGSRDFPC